MIGILGAIPLNYLLMGNQSEACARWWLGRGGTAVRLAPNGQAGAGQNGVVWHKVGTGV